MYRGDGEISEEMSDKAERPLTQPLLHKFQHLFDCGSPSTNLNNFLVARISQAISVVLRATKVQFSSVLQALGPN